MLALLAVAAVACAAPAPQESLVGSSEAARAVAAIKRAEKQRTKAADTADSTRSAAAADPSDLDGSATDATTARRSTDSDSPNGDRTAKRSERQRAAAGSEDSARPGRAGDQAKLDATVVDVSATVEPACVQSGKTVTITIVSAPDAGIGYHAFYSDGKGGGPPPYGADYGGNSGGMADGRGQYTDTWTVAPTAPAGPARVDVVASHDGGYGKTSIPFAVADAVTGTCQP